MKPLVHYNSLASRSFAAFAIIALVFFWMSYYWVSPVAARTTPIISESTRFTDMMALSMSDCLGLAASLAAVCRLSKTGLQGFVSTADPVGLANDETLDTASTMNKTQNRHL